MSIVLAAWIYVVLMIALAEAFGPGGSVLGSLGTLLLWGVLPVALLNALGRARRRPPTGDDAGHPSPDTKPD